MASKKFDEVFVRWSQVNKELDKECTKYISEILENAEGHRVEISCNYPICVEYDGGNHPEYASNCYNDVYAVVKEDDRIYLVTKDCDEYPLEKLTAIEKLTVASGIEYSVECPLNKY
jgi:hypothetical protein